MNKLNGTIIQVRSSAQMSIVEVDVDGDIFSAIVLETPAGAPHLKAANTIGLIFKETEVSLAKDLSGLISIRNRFKARVRRIEKHEILTTVVLTYKTFDIVSIISTKSALRLELKDNDEVEWLVKTNEVSLCPAT